MVGRPLAADAHILARARSGELIRAGFTVQQKGPASGAFLLDGETGANQLARSRAGKYVGICGQGPSDHADLAEWLMEQGIQSISLNPDTVVDTWLKLARH